VFCGPHHLSSFNISGITGQVMTVQAACLGTKLKQSYKSVTTWNQYLGLVC